MNYHDRAQAGIKIAKMLLDSNSSNDEAFYDAAAYHAQQGIEKELKHILASGFR